MTKYWLAAIAVVAGCATAPGTSTTPNMTPEVMIDQSGRVYRTTNAAAMAKFPTPPDSTFRALVVAYNKLGIEPGTVDAAQRVVARQRFVLRSQFEGERLSTAFDCGNGQLGALADQGRITADLTSRVMASESGSTVATNIQAAVTINDGTARDPIRCVSNGTIEEKLRRLMSLQLGVHYEKNQ